MGQDPVSIVGMVDAARQEELALARANKELDYWGHIDFMDDPNQPHQGPPDDLRRSSRRRPRRGSSSSRAPRTRGPSLTHEPNLPLLNQPSTSSSIPHYPPPHFDPTRHPAFPGHLNLHDPHQNFGHISPSPLDSSLSAFQWPSPVTPGGLPPAWSLQQANMAQYPMDPHGFPHFPPQAQLPPILPGAPSHIHFPPMPPQPQQQHQQQFQRHRQDSVESRDPQDEPQPGDSLALAEEKRKRNTLASGILLPSRPRDESLTGFKLDLESRRSRGR